MISGLFAFMYLEKLGFFTKDLRPLTFQEQIVIVLERNLPSPSLSLNYSLADFLFRLPQAPSTIFPFFFNDFDLFGD